MEPIHGMETEHESQICRACNGSGESRTTPAAKWREEGRPDPHGHHDHYDGERAQLCNGHMTDDELANEVYLNPGIANLTAAKERIRWLSRALSRSQQELGLTGIALDHKSRLLDSCEKALSERDFPGSA